MARIWVRIQDLPWGFLNTEWTVRILSHVGLVDAIDDEYSGLPHQSFLRARLVLDITKPLIPGCFLPMHGGRVGWICFRYEGVFKFCKECGCVGHNTGRCPLSAYEAQRLIMRRIETFEDHGMLILQTHENLPLYTNMIRGLIDRFIHRNPRVNLLQFRPHMDPPSPDPYLFPHLYVPHQTQSDSTSDEFYDTSPELPHPFPSNEYPYLSDENIQNYSYSPDLSALPYQTTPTIPITQPVWLSPGRSYGLSSETCASFTPQRQPHKSYFDLNLSPTPSQNIPPQPTTHIATTENDNRTSDSQHSRFSLLRRLSETNWAQGSLRIINGFCVPIGRLNRERSQPSPPSDSVVRHGNGSLASLVAQGWALQPPGPSEAGPSNWVERNLRDLQLDTTHAEADQTTQPLPEFHTVSNITNNRFRVSPPPFADVFNPNLQEHNAPVLGHDHADDIYSPTSPLHITFTSSDSEEVNNYEIADLQQQREVVLGLPVHYSTFGNKRRREEIIDRSHSMESFFIFAGTNDIIKRKCRKKRYEEWDAKGGFNVCVPAGSKRIISKAVTDTSMAADMGVEPDFQMRDDKKKRNAATSPMDPTGEWSLKSSKPSSVSLQAEEQFMECETSNNDPTPTLDMTDTIMDTSREVTGPNQSPNTQ